MTRPEMHCVGWKPILPSMQDVLTPGTARQLDDHNVYGEKTCGWKAPHPDTK